MYVCLTDHVSTNTNHAVDSIFNNDLSNIEGVVKLQIPVHVFTFEWAAAAELTSQASQYVGTRFPSGKRQTYISCVSLRLWSGLQKCWIKESQVTAGVGDKRRGAVRQHPSSLTHSSKGRQDEAPQAQLGQP